MQFIDLSSSAGIANSIASSLGNVLNTFVVGVLILLIGFTFGRILGKFVQIILHEFRLNSAVRKSFGLKFALEDAIGAIISWTIYFFTILLALSYMGISRQVADALAAIALAVLALSIVFALKDFMPNFVAGVIIQQRHLLKKDQKLKLNGISGRVSELGLLETKLTTVKGDTIFFPNSLLFKQKVVSLR